MQQKGINRRGHFQLLHVCNEKLSTVRREVVEITEFLRHGFGSCSHTGFVFGSVTQLLIKSLNFIIRKIGKYNISVKVKVAQSCPTLCDPMACTTPASSVHGILLARVLEWVASPFSRDLLDPGVRPRSLTLQADSLPSESPGSLINYLMR